MTNLDHYYRTHQQYVRTICRSFFKNDPMWIEEAEGRVWEKVVKNFQNFKGSSTFKTWAHRITINECLNLREHVHSMNKKKVAYVSKINNNPFTRIDFNTPETLLSAKQTKSEIGRVLRRLRKTHRRIYKHRYIDLMKYGDVADKMKIRTGTVRSRINKIKGEIEKIDTEQITHPIEVKNNNFYTMYNHQENIAEDNNE